MARKAKRKKTSDPRSKSGSTNTSNEMDDIEEYDENGVPIVTPGRSGSTNTEDYDEEEDDEEDSFEEENYDEYEDGEEDVYEEGGEAYTEEGGFDEEDGTTEGGNYDYDEELFLEGDGEDIYEDEIEAGLGLDADEYENDPAV
jgi:hypothetical protein